MTVDTVRGVRGRVAPDTHVIELERLGYQEASHPACEPLNIQAMVWLLRAYNALINAQAEELRPVGLSPSAFNVLMALHNTEDHMLEPCQLAQRLLISRPSVTGLLDTLQTKGLITRQPHADDRRRILVTLTEEGRSVLESCFASHYAGVNAAFADLTSDEVETLVTLLRRVRGATPADMADVDITTG